MGDLPRKLSPSWLGELGHYRRGKIVLPLDWMNRDLFTIMLPMSFAVLVTFSNLAKHNGDRARWNLIFSERPVPPSLSSSSCSHFLFESLPNLLVFFALNRSHENGSAHLEFLNKVFVLKPQCQRIGWSRNWMKHVDVVELRNDDVDGDDDDCGDDRWQ